MFYPHILYGLSVNHYEGRLKKVSMDLENAYDKIYRYVYFRIKDQTVAEDITQETFLHFISRKGNIHDYEMKYLYTIARNLCIDESRKARTEELPEDYSDEGDGADELIRKIEVNQALDKMTEEDRELLILRYMNDMSLADICEIMGISRFALYSKLNSVKRDFIKLMEGGNLHE